MEMFVQSSGFLELWMLTIIYVCWNFHSSMQAVCHSLTFWASLAGCARQLGHPRLIINSLLCMRLQISVGSAALTSLTALWKLLIQLNGAVKHSDAGMELEWHEAFVHRPASHWQMRLFSNRVATQDLLLEDSVLCIVPGQPFT